MIELPHEYERKQHIALYPLTCTQCPTEWVVKITSVYVKL